MEAITLSINGKRVTCQAGSSILDAATDNGIQIPTLCHHPELKPFGACRLCLVEEGKSGRTLASCVTPAAPDMTIRTDTDRMQTLRRNIIRLMIAEHPESCVVCNKGNRCELRRLAAQLGIGETGLRPMPNAKSLEQANPFIVRDLSKCILCGKCIRADHELVGVGAIDYNLRGFKSRPTTVHDRGLEQSSCTFCGVCVSMCPTGALFPKNETYVGSPERESYSICGYCGVGCNLALGVADDKVIEVNPAPFSGTVNGATLCVRGYFGHDFLNGAGRLDQPLVCTNGNPDSRMAPATWNDALDKVAGRLRDIRKRHGPRSVAFLGSSKCTNEENYLFQKIARALLNTNNVDNGGYVQGRALLNRMEKRTRGRSRLAPLSELEKAQAVLLLGADPGHSVPVLSYYLKRAARKGVPILTANILPTEAADFASVRFDLGLSADTGSPYGKFIDGLAATLYAEKAYDAAFIERFTEGFQVYFDGLSRFDHDRFKWETGIDGGALKAAVDLLKGKKIAFVVGSAIVQGPCATQIVDALLNLAWMTGGLSAGKTGIYVVSRENNLVGAWDMGAVPDALPGRRSLKDKASRNIFEEAWQVSLSPDQGLDMIGMIEAAEKGDLKALYIMGENPLRSLPQPERVRKALAKVDFIVVQDILLSETAQIADIVLPGAAFAEKGGSFTNMEGRIQSFDPAVLPPGEARPDWKILAMLASRLGDPAPWASLKEGVAEIRGLVPMYAQLQPTHGSGWITAADGQATKTMPRFTFTAPVSSIGPMEEEALRNDYPFTAVLISRRWHLGSGTRTAHSNRIMAFGLKSEVEIAVEDGEKLGLNDGDHVRVISRWGEILRPIRLSRRLNPGRLTVPLAVNGNDAMNLVPLVPLYGAKSTGWKTCRVKLARPNPK